METQIFNILNSNYSSDSVIAMRETGDLSVLSPEDQKTADINKRIANERGEGIINKSLRERVVTQSSETSPKIKPTFDKIVLQLFSEDHLTVGELKSIYNEYIINSILEKISEYLLKSIELRYNQNIIVWHNVGVHSGLVVKVFKNVYSEQLLKCHSFQQLLTQKA